MSAYNLLENRKTMEHERDSDTNCNCGTQYSHQKISIGTKRLGNSRINGNHPNYCIIKTIQHIEKSPVDLRRLAVTQIPVENYEPTLV